MREDTFKEDLLVGKYTERYVLGLLQKKYPKARMVDGYEKRGDIYVPEKNMWVEVKQDQKSNFTGNLVIEIQMNGKPSALMTTESYFWVFSDGVNLMWIEPRDIWDCIIKTNTPLRSFIGKGDTKSKLAFLVNKEIIKNKSKLTEIKEAICITK